MSLVYGIDFGTSQSAVMISQDDRTPLLAHDPHDPLGSGSVPTSICLLEDGTLAVGVIAERAMGLRPDCYRTGFKMLFGEPHPLYLGGREFWPHELAAEILRFLRHLAVDLIPAEPDGVVLTVPASWEKTNLGLLVKAAELAGFNPDRLWLRPEPVAAAAHIFGEPNGEPFTALIFDLGGGTFDCAVARTTGDGTFETLGPAGYVDRLGGAEFDRQILKRIREQYPDQSAWLDKDLSADRDLLRRALSLTKTCENLKIKLSSVKSYDADLTELSEFVEFTLSRRELATILRPLLDHTVAECERILTTCGLTWKDIDRIVPVGGSSRLPFVGELLAAKWKRPVVKHPDPEFAVVAGAVLLAQRYVSVGLPPDGDARVQSTRDRPAALPAPAPRIVRHRAGALAVALSRDGSRMAVGGKGYIQVSDLPTGKLLWTCRLGNETNYSPGVAFSSDGNVLAAACYDNTARIFTAQDGHLRRTVAHTDWVHGVALNYDGSRLATAGYDGTVRVWNTRSGGQVAIFSHSTRMKAVALSPNGQLLATGGSDYLVRLCRLSDGTELVRLHHDDWINGITFNHDGTRLATASYDQTACVWSVPTGDRLTEIRSPGSVRSVAFSPDQKLLATCGDDRTARVWHIMTGEQQSMESHDDWVHGVSFTSDGTRLVSASHDGTVRVSAIAA